MLSLDLSLGLLLCIEWLPTILKQEIKNLLLIVFLRPLSRRHVFLVFEIEIDSLPKQVLDDVVSLQLDRVVDGTLKLVVYVVMMSSTTDQLLCHFQVAFSDAVEDACLAVLVCTINIASLIDKVVDHT